jgi:hypothetical protein
MSHRRIVKEELRSQVYKMEISFIALTRNAIDYRVVIMEKHKPPCECANRTVCFNVRHSDIDAYIESKKDGFVLLIKENM